MKRLTILPVLLILFVIAVPLLFGDQPVHWGSAVASGGDVVDRRLHPGGGRERYPVAAVEKPWQPGQPQLGVQVYWEAGHRDTERQVWSKAQRTVDYVVGLDSNAISIAFPMFTDGATANDVHAGPATPTPERLAQLVHEARAAGLRVNLRPLLDEQVLARSNDWRGGLRPASRPEWFANYSRMLAPYLKLAEDEDVDSVTIGVELNSLEQDHRWRQVITGARKLFTGQLEYDSNWDTFVRGNRAYPAGDLFGTDIYFRTELPPDATSKDIAAAWSHFLDRRHTGPMPDVLFSEVGIVTRKGAYQSPANFHRDGVFDADVQPTWYRAACSVARQRRTAGIYFWKTDFGVDPTKPPDALQGNLDFTGFPRSEQAIRDCFAGWAGR